MKNKFYTLLFLCIVAALTLYLPLRLHKSFSANTQNQSSSIISSTFYNDAYYYFNIADNYSKSGISSYDGKHPTNGYNFLWQTILNVSFTKITNKQSQLELVLILCILLSLASNLIIFVIVFKLTKSRILSLFSIFPGFFYLLFSPGLGIHYSPWSVINGMESALNLFVFSMFLFVSVLFTENKIEKKWYYLMTSIILTILVLCRFDEIFLLLAFGLFVFSNEKNNRWRILLVNSVIPIVSLLIYVSYNWIVFGLPVPVSGLVKSSFYPQNLLHVFNGLISGTSFDYLAGEHLYSRMLPLMMPLIFIPIIIKLLKNHYESNHNWNSLLSILNYYVIMKSVYILLFVDFWHQGQWYFYNNIAILNILTAVLISIKLISLLNNKIIQSAVVFVIIISHSYFHNIQADIDKSIKLRKSNIKKIDELVSTYLPNGKIIEMDDGIIAYSINNESMSGFGLCLDKDGYHALKNGVLLDIAYQRGYRYIASVNYFKSPELIPNKINNISDFAAIPFFALENEDLRKWHFATVIKDTESQLIVVYFEKK